MPFRDMLSDDLIRHLIKLLRPEPGLPLARIDLPGMHPVCHPVAAIIAVIEEERLKIIHRSREPGLRSLSGLEFIKNRHELRFLVLRQY